MNQYPGHKLVLELDLHQDRGLSDECKLININSLISNVSKLDIPVLKNILY